MATDEIPSFAAQNDIISNLTILNDKLQTRIGSLEKALKDRDAAESAGPADPKEIKALKEQLSHAGASLKRKEKRRECCRISSSGLS